MIARFATRLAMETDPRALLSFVYRFGWKGRRAVVRHRRRRAMGRVLPAFLFVSITDRCNLRCRGCWAWGGSEPRDMSPGMLDQIIAEGKAAGVSFFGILGGEPLLYDGLATVLARHPDVYFIVFTNGTLLTDAWAGQLRRLSNVSPLVSIEGDEAESDLRRGAKRVYAQSMNGLAVCRAHRLVTGVATSVCRANFDHVVDESFVRDLARRGVHYLWYYIYRPAGPSPVPEHALDREQVLSLRRFLIEVRRRAPMLIVDGYWDHEGRALCPAATGISCHIGPAGDVEACPPVQFAVDRIDAGRPVAETVVDSRYLKRFRETAGQASPGCILLEDPARLGALVDAEGARDTSGRGTARAELAAMCARPSHYVAGAEMPETHWLYRAMKRAWFFGLAGYG